MNSLNFSSSLAPSQLPGGPEPTSSLYALCVLAECTDHFEVAICQGGFHPVSGQYWLNTRYPDIL